MTSHSSTADPRHDAASEHVEVAIVGAGFAGLAAAMELQAVGIDDVVILERGDDLGGTWRDNIYPGVACDVPAALYAFARHPWHGWSGEYAPGGEIHDYLGAVATRTGLRERIRLHTALRAARWHVDHWDLDIVGGRMRARTLILACGRLTEPAIPDIPGLETFDGEVVHTARWDDALPLRGRRIAVVGTGASGVQLVPELVRRGAAVTLFQRSAPWILPRGGRSYTAADREYAVRHPEVWAGERERAYREGEQRFASRAGDSAEAAAATSAALAHLERQVSDPVLRAALTPDYAFGCKRVLLSDDFYPAVNSDAVTLEPTPLARVHGDTLTAASGRTHSVDSLVFATGFSATRQPYARLVTGEHGTTLDEHWSAGMTSALSTIVTGFPELFVLNGPNAALGHNSSILMLEEQAGYVARTLAARPRGSILRPDPAAEDAYTRRIIARSRTTAWVSGGCRNWYVDERSGRLTLLWPGTVEEFRALLRGADGSEFLREPVGSERRIGS